MGRPKTYIIRLSEEERATLRKTIRNITFEEKARKKGGSVVK